jgi:hypothetical protein
MSMVEISDFQPTDADDIQPQPQQALELSAIADWRAMIRTAASTGPAWTGRTHGRIIGCAGFSLRWTGRAHAWCVLADAIPQSAWIGIHRAVVVRMAQMQALGVWRIEAEAAWQFFPGNRWLRLLGFEYEGLARGFGPGGEDFNRYARVTL